MDNLIQFIAQSVDKLLRLDDSIAIVLAAHIEAGIKYYSQCRECQ